MIRTLAFSREEFAADRRPILARAAEALAEAVRTALDSRDWDALADTAAAYAQFVAGEESESPDLTVIAAFRTSLSAMLTQTTPDGTEAQQQRITDWLATASVNVGTIAAAAGDGDLLTLEWVTMDDSAVRLSHQEVDGETALPGETFNVGGYELHYPGEPVGPPDVWINCRCVVRPTLEDEMTRSTTKPEARASLRQALAAAADEPVETDDDLPEDDEDEVALLSNQDAWDGLETEVPWHGVLAPVGVMSGDRRKFADGSISYRDLPLPLKWMPDDQPGHDGSMVVGNIQYAEERDGLIHGGGVFRDGDAYAANAIDQVANEMQRGVSVDLDAAAAEYQDETGSPFDFEQEFDPSAPGPVEVITTGRLASATLCAIPAFQEAYIALGPEGDDAPSPSAEFARERGADCEPCEALTLIEAASVEHAREFGAVLETLARYDGTELQAPVPQEFTAADGTRYVFDAEGVQVFAPGTHDGPGWVTNPKETQRLRTYWTRGKGAAKIRWGQGGDFNRCRKQLAKYVPNPDYLAGTCANLHRVALGFWPGNHRGKVASGTPTAPAYSLVASAEAALPRGEWFADPGLEGPTPLTVTSDGRVFGHLATWGTCHVGYLGECTAPPQSAANYGYFTTGAIDTDTGEVAVGQITMDTGHASTGPGVRMSDAVAHYDHTGTVVADVAAGEDAYGIWIAGALRPGVSQEQRAALKAASLSGDWRDVRGNLELVAALAVNVPGFPIPRMSIAASAGHQTALVASGIVERAIDREVTNLTEVAAKDLVAAAIREYKASERRDEKAREMRERLRGEWKAHLRREVGL